MARSIETPTFTSDIHKRHYGLRNSSHKILIFRFNSASEVKRSAYYPTERHPLHTSILEIRNLYPISRDIVSSLPDSGRDIGIDPRL